MNDQHSMDLSLIIVNWNTKHLLEQCLTSVFAYLPESKCEVWVIDNASTDDSIQMIREHFPQVRLIENQQNVGFAHANNQAIRRSAGRYVFLLNPDTEVKPQALERILEFMDLHPEVGAAGSMLLNPDGTLQTSCYPLPTLSRELWRLLHLDKMRTYGVYNMNSWDLDEPREVEVVQGASLILRREALDQVGVLDEDFFMYTEEVDLCDRLSKADWHLYWVPKSQIVHYGGQSTQQVAAEMFLSLYQTKLLYFRKNQGRLAALVYKMILLVVSLARIVLCPLALLKKAPERDQYLIVAGHYLRLFKKLPGM